MLMVFIAGQKAFDAAVYKTVKWTVRFGDTVAGGTVYELSEKVDNGAIVLQRSAWSSCLRYCG